MEDLLINEGYSVGLIKFGMKMDEVEHCIKLYSEKYNDSIGNSFLCEYDEEGKVVSIQLIIENLREHFHCNFKGIDIFNTKACKLVEIFDDITPYIRDQEASLGYMYQFPDLGLIFWRGNVCTEEELESEWFKELDPDIQEDNKRFLYFETVRFNKVKK